MGVMETAHNRIRRFFGPSPPRTRPRAREGDGEECCCPSPHGRTTRKTKIFPKKEENSL